MRLLVLTRNLTADRAWDLAVSLDGTVQPTGPRERAVPALFRWALGHVSGPGLTDARAARLDQLLDDASRTVWDKPDDAWELTLHALGVGRPNDLKLSGTRALVVSPFVQPDGLDLIDARSLTIVSRPEELDRLDPSMLTRADARVLNEAAWLSEGAEDNRLTGLHAKAYVLEYDRRAWMILGSPNATRPGLAGDGRANVEFAVTLEGSKTTFGIDRWLSDDSLGHLLVDYERHDPLAADETMAQLEATLRGLAGIAFSAHATQEGAAWTEEVWADEPVRVRPGQLLRLELLTLRGRRLGIGTGPADASRFDGLDPQQVTPFLVVTVEQDGESASSCLRATMVADVPDRLDHVLAGQVDTAEKFLRWLLMLLADDPGVDFLGAGEGARDSASWFARAQERGLFEAMVTSLAERPEQLQLIERFVSRVARGADHADVLPEGFLELWSVVRDAVGRGAAA